MAQTLGYVTLVVRNYDEALVFFTHSLGFTVVEDTALGGGKRWVLVRPPNSQGTSLLLAQAATAEQENRIGNQTGGRVFLFLHTDDFWRDYHEMTARGVQVQRGAAGRNLRHSCRLRGPVWK
jgi:lactoylglutathione lyase